MLFPLCSKCSTSQNSGELQFFSGKNEITLCPFRAVIIVIVEYGSADRKILPSSTSTPEAFLNYPGKKAILRLIFLQRSDKNEENHEGNATVLYLYQARNQGKKGRISIKGVEKTVEVH